MTESKGEFCSCSHYTWSLFLTLFLNRKESGLFIHQFIRCFEYGGPQDRYCRMQFYKLEPYIQRRKSLIEKCRHIHKELPCSMVKDASPHTRTHQSLHSLPWQTCRVHPCTSHSTEFMGAHR